MNHMTNVPQLSLKEESTDIIYLDLLLKYLIFKKKYLYTEHIRTEKLWNQYNALLSMFKKEIVVIFKN